MIHHLIINRILPVADTPQAHGRTGPQLGLLLANPAAPRDVVGEYSEDNVRHGRNADSRRLLSACVRYVLGMVCGCQWRPRSSQQLWKEEKECFRLHHVS